MRSQYLVILLLLAACSDGDVGEECDTSGSTDECVEGAICTNEGDVAACRQICTDQPDCPSGEACNGVCGSNIKSCQPE